MRKKPTRKQTHLVLPTHKANAEKPKEPVFLPTHLKENDRIQEHNNGTNKEQGNLETTKA